jgi:hypothetical protein
VCDGGLVFAARGGFVNGHVRVPVTNDAALPKSPEDQTEEGVAVRRLSERAGV